MAGKASQSGETAEQLRDDIDAGRTGDKVPWPDPAAAPLGTDDEAAGTTTRGGHVRQARAQERSGPGRSPTTNHRSIGASWILILFVAALALALLVYIGQHVLG
jgi:hypothetical protein